MSALLLTNKRKTILIISNSSWNIYNFRISLGEYLTSKGFSIIFAASKDNFSKKLSNFKFYPIFIKNKSKNIFYEIKTLIDIIFLINKIKPNVVLTFTIKPNLYLSILSKFFNYILITNITGRGDIFDSNNFFIKFISSLYVRSNNMSNFVFFQNSNDYNFFKKNKFTNFRYDILPGSGTNFEKFNLNYINRTKNLKFIFSSRLLKKKGILYFIQIASLLRSENSNFSFDVSGELLNNNMYLDKIILDEAIKSGAINFLKFESNMHLLLKEYDFLILPSTYNEGFPKIVIEAFASGVIPIVSHQIAKLIKNYGDFYFLELDQKNNLDIDLKKIKRLKRNEDLNRNIYKNYNLAKKKFDQNIIFQKYYEEISKLSK